MTRAPYDPRDVLPPRSEIMPGLWMGKRPDTYVGYDVVVSCEKHLARKPMNGYSGLTLHLPMDDTDDFDLVALEGTLWSVANVLIETVREDEKQALVHCTGGLNRSGVVVAHALMAGWLMTGSEAVSLIRAKRDRYALCNEAFARFCEGSA